MKFSSVLPLLFLGVTGKVPVVMAQSPGTFTPTGSMTTSRVSHTATLLADGRVLIAGGSGGYAFASAEVYDPSTGTFTATGDMFTGRVFGHAATLLPDGRVLIAGGAIASSSAGVTNTAKAEVYDPSTRMFAAAGNMITAKACPAAVLLGSGKVLIAGGANWNQPSSAANAELYDPATGTFTYAGPYANSNPRRNVDLDLCPAANLVPDGRVLIVWDDLDSSAEVYDPSAGTFIAAGSMVRPPGLISPATLLTNGQVLFAGGEDGEEADGVPNAELYDPSSRTSAPTGSMTTPRSGHTSTLLPDGTVLIAGSQRSRFDGGDALASAELYDPAAGTFSATGDMTTARFSHTTTLLSDGRVLIAGGLCNACSGVSIFPDRSAEIYRPTVLIPAPVLLALSGDGQGQGAIWHAATGQIASASSPASAGEALAMYSTSLVDGGVIPPQVVIGGRLAEILFFGNAPGYPGFNQVNVRLPSGIAPGDAVPVRLTYLSRPSNEVTIGVR